MAAGYIAGRRCRYSTRLLYSGSRRTPTLTTAHTDSTATQPSSHIDKLIYCIRWLVGWLVGSFVRSFVRSCVRAFVHSFVRSSIRPFVRSFVRPPVRSFVHSSIRSFVRSYISNDSFAHSFIRSIIIAHRFASYTYEEGVFCQIPHKRKAIIIDIGCSVFIVNLYKKSNIVYIIVEAAF